MSTLVLYYDLWPLTGPSEALAKTVAAVVGARAVAWDKRPHLGIYDAVALVVPVVGLLDPRVQAIAADGELRGKTVALVTDAPGPWPALLFLEWTALASVVGGATLYEEPLHLGPWRPAGLIGPWTIREDARDRARAWAKRLAQAFPTPVYPRGEAGSRKMGG